MISNPRGDGKEQPNLYGWYHKTRDGTMLRAMECAFQKGYESWFVLTAGAFLCYTSIGAGKVDS